MPQPEAARDLVILEVGAPEFRQGNWWTQFKEGKVFFPRGFAQGMTKIGLESVDTVEDFIGPAIEHIEKHTGWQDQCFDRRHWNSCSREQLSDAAAERPMLLTKAAICIVALQLCADRRGRIFDAFEEVRLLPGAYEAVGWDEEKLKIATGSIAYQEFLKQAKESFLQDQAAAILEDTAKGLHGTYGLVNLAAHCFAGRGVTIGIARRRGREGMKAASRNIRPTYRI